MLSIQLYLATTLIFVVLLTVRTRLSGRFRLAWVLPGILVLAFVWLKYALSAQMTSLSLGYLCSMLVLAAALLRAPPKLIHRASVRRWYPWLYYAIIIIYVVFALQSEHERKRIFYDPNTEIMILILLAFPLVIIASRRRLRLQLLLFVSWTVLVALSQSRTGLAVIAFLALCTLWPVRMLLRVRLLVMFLALSMVGLSMLLPFYRGAEREPEGVKRVISLSDGSFAERQLLVKQGLQLWWGDPVNRLIGVPTSHLDALGATNVMHNGFLELLVATGIMGLVAFTGLFTLFAWRYLDPVTTPLFLAYVLASGFSVLLLNSLLFIIFVITISNGMRRDRAADRSSKPS